MTKKYILILLCTLLSGTFVFGAPKADVSVTSKKANVIVNEQYHPGINLYTIDDTKFLSLKEMAAVYNATLDWKAVSGKVVMMLNNRKVDVFLNSKNVRYGKKKKKLDTPSRFIKDEVYVSPELFINDLFTDISDMVTSFNQDTGIVTITSKGNISAVRYYTRAANTEIAIELDEKMFYSVKKGNKSIMVYFQRGKIAKGNIIANNGAIKDISYETAGREAVFQINLAQTPKVVKSKFYKHQMKLVIDIEHSAPVDMTRTCEIVLPETINDGIKQKDAVADVPKADDTAKQQAKTKADSVPDAKIIAADSRIYDIVKKDEEDKEALSKVEVATISESAIIDDTYTIIDDTETLKDIMPVETGKKQYVKKIIVLDAGHGGEDPGAIGPNGTKEKEINLAIVLELNKIFKRDKEYEIILTRDDDTFVPLVERANIANESKADLFLSVHCNANFKRDISGFEIYFLSETASDSDAAATEMLENSVLALEGKPDKKRTVLQNMLWSMVVNEYINESSELASFISCETPGRLKIQNRGIKQAGFYVLRGTQMPSVLVESAYLSNYAEEAKLNTKSFQVSVADSIYEGVKKYYARKAKNEKIK